MKKNTTDKLSIFYDSFMLKMSLGLFALSIIASIVIICLPTETTTRWTYHNLSAARVLPPFFLLLMLFYMRKRTIDANGISASFLGITYKQIPWDNLSSYKTEYLIPKGRNKNNPDLAKEMIIFSSQLNENGKTTIIMMDSSPDALLLIEKYYRKTTIA